ncbi:4-hydroxy-tetrahydrodipicolinate synthase [Chlamydia sp.]|uniref:4-hydroxy-tetrahydrodipicolinate synthase n=1 Tax=Chlamydia sp. TaxID=35827 RepID=UPI0025BF646B|nr:4-hydroxy-tetrahydrodipicolinate synthase [Chlamydia sp.]MBQ8498237.1 4-hydroxy-tetrahydrodipicolinate synthase [Chlamydia sp.]
MSVLTACITPFKADLSIDFSALEGIVRAQEHAGNGVFLFGSTGEGLSLTYEEKFSILSFVSTLNLNVPIFLGVTATSIQETLSWICFAQQWPIEGFFVPTPLYTKPGIQGQKAWFDKILSVSKKPIIFYNNPSRTGVSLYPEVVQAFASHPLCMGVKDSGGFVQVCKLFAKSGLKIFCGDDGLWPDMQLYGASGVVSVLSNVWPELARDYIAHGHSLDTWKKVCAWLNLSTNPLGIKALMAAQKMIECEAVRLPLSVQDLQERNSLTGILACRSTLQSELISVCKQ